jgi:hypothetical protein
MAVPKYIQELIQSINDLKYLMLEANNKLDKQYVLLEKRIETVEKKTEKHDDTLYRSNGKTGLVEDFKNVKKSIQDKEDQEKEAREERRKLKFGVYLLLSGVGIDLVVRYLF